MMTSVAKRAKPSGKQAASDDPEKLWEVFARIDYSLRDRVDKYIKSREYPPHLARVIEKAVRDLLEKEGF